MPLLTADHISLWQCAEINGEAAIERKSLWHLSAPCYHIPISMGDNFETACTALRTNVPAGACKDENLSPCFQSLLLKFAFQRHLPLVERAALQALGTSDLLLRKESNQGGKRAVSWQGRDFGRGEWDWPLWTLSPSLVSSGSSSLVLKADFPQVGRRSQGLCRPSTNWS